VDLTGVEEVTLVPVLTGVEEVFDTELDLTGMEEVFDTELDLTGMEEVTLEPVLTGVVELI
jgi:hypothetical protein